MLSLCKIGNAKTRDISNILDAHVYTKMGAIEFRKPNDIESLSSMQSTYTVSEIPAKSKEYNFFTSGSLTTMRNINSFPSLLDYELASSSQTKQWSVDSVAFR